MARIDDILREGTSYSFEFFPPRDEQAEVVLARTLRALEPLGPSYVSVTYGAGGTTRERTHDLVVTINGSTTMTAMAHLTCAAHTRAELVEVVTRYRDAGVENILALGGDPPKDLELPPGELHYAIELVDLAREVGDFAIGVAAHPEPHPRSPSLASDRAHTAEKLARADFAITQFFFEVEHYKRMVDELADLGCEVPVIPGVMPFVSVPGTRRMAGINNTEIPDWLNERLDAVDGDAEATRQLGVEVATDLVAELLDYGVPGVHLYAMNRAQSIKEIYGKLGLLG